MTKKKWLASRFAEIVARCAAMGHPRPDWQDRFTDTGTPWWSQDSCPCGESGTSGSSTRPGTYRHRQVWGEPTTADYMVRCTCATTALCLIHDVQVFS